MSLSDRIKEAMDSAGLSPADLARATKRTPGAVTQWLDGTTKSLKADTANMIEIATGYRSAWLVTGMGAKKNQTDFASVVNGETGNVKRFGNGAPAPNASGIPPHKFKPVWVVGRGVGGLMPESIWSDGDYPVGATEGYAEIASQDEHAFLTEVVGISMVPRYNPGEYALVEPGTDPDIEDDVLVRLKDGQTLLKRLLSRRGGYRLGSYNNAEIHFYEPEQVTWIYYVAHPVPRRKIKQRAGADIDLNW